MLTLPLLATLLTVSAFPANFTKRSSGKAGISWPQQERSALPVQKFFGAGSGLTWWWNWNKNYSPGLFTYDSFKPDIEATFVPMQYDTAMLYNQDPLEDGWQEIMGYNEPDLYTKTGVSVPLPVNVAGDNWKTMVSHLRNVNPNAIFWSPGVAWNKDWLAGFFDYICPGGLSGCEWAPQYLTVHVYALDIQNFQSQVNAYHDQFGLDIVISEYACYTFDGSDPQPSMEQVSAFMAQTTSWLDSTPWIHKYAWFGAVRDERWLWDVAPSNRLMDASGALTKLGKQYIAGGQT